jgi:hypothetical protein
MQVTNLRVELPELPITEYQITDGNLEFRLLDPDGHAYPDWRSEWKKLTPGDIALHFRFNTVVGRWFEDRVADWRTEEGAASEMPRAA